MLNTYLNFDGKCREAFEFYCSYFGSCADKFGINWQVNYEQEQS